MLLYFFVCFLFFFLVFFVNQILLMAEDILSKKAPVRDVATLIIFSLPAIIATSAPFAALVGTLMALGRLVSDREILSINALGIPVRFVLMPVLAVGILVSIGSFFTNDILLPAGTIRFNRLYRKIITSTPALELESNSIKRNQNAIIVSGTIKDGVMDSLLVIDSTDSGNKRIIAAPSAEIVQSSDAAVLMTLDMADAKIISFDRKNRTDYDVLNASGLSYNVLSKNILPSYSDTKQINLYRMEFHKKFSIPFGAFFFVVLAFPLGMFAKTNGQSVGFIFGLIIAVLYWALLIGGQTLSVRLGFDGFVMMWLPNALVFATGAILGGRYLIR